MPKKIDLTGQKFGRLTVLEDGGRTKDKRVIWRCKCDCGNIKNVRLSNLQSGATQSCGCYRDEQTTKRMKIDLTGQIFGRLTVLEDAGHINKKILWKCVCDCGNIVNVRSGDLHKGHTQSCGCLHKEQISEALAGESNWNWKGGITPLRKRIRDCTHYKEWRTLVFQRDNFTCVHCNQIGHKLNAHHTTRFSKIMKEHNITTLEEAIQCEALWEVSNGITLCKKCHRKAHKRKT